jgi:YidC/Oxa1 family membrane protein insertase
VFDSPAYLALQFLSAITQVVSPVFGTGAAAAAIVLGTAAIRLCLVPVGVAQYRAQVRQSALLARVAELRDRHGENKPKLEAELTELYRAEGGGMLRGCLPMLVQLPVFAALYHLAVSPTLHGHANTLLQHTLFGAPLGAHLTSAPPSQLVVFGVLLALLAAVGYASTRLATGPRPDNVLIRILPYASVVTAVFLPLAASLYLVTTTAWTVAQTAVLRNL